MFRVRDIFKNDVFWGGFLCPISLKRKVSPQSVLVAFTLFSLHLPPKLELNDVMVNSTVKVKAITSCILYEFFVMHRIK